MKHRALCVAILLSSANSFALSGKIIDEQGAPIAGAVIEIEDSNEIVRSRADGKFELTADKIDELHIEADGYSHKIIHLHGDHEDSITITLRSSPLQVVDVIGLPLHASKIESAQPVSVLAGDELIKQQASTLGETLKNQVGVQSTYYGGVTSSPIIRGLDGPRVLITQNGLDVSDASRVGPDHATTTEASTAEQIEILRGPATLFYGSGAIGGVVNIVDDRVPSDNQTKASALVEQNSVNDGLAASAAYTGGTDQISFHIDGFWRDSKDYEIPGLAEYETEEEHEEEDHEEHTGGKLENSASEGSGINVGASWLLDKGYIGISYGRLDQLNGVPGHAHEEHEEELEAEVEEEHAEAYILSDLKQDRLQLISELNVGGQFLSAINTRIGLTDYEHAEIHDEEGEETEEETDSEHEEGTVFKNQTLQARVDLIHQEVGGWKGAIGLETKRVDFEAVGEEAFTPPSLTQEFALAVVEEKHIGALLWQFGARIEKVSLEADDLVLHAHDVGEEIDNAEESELISFERFDFTPLSLSAGLVWDFADGYNIGVSLAHAERAPSAAELFSAGPHIGTRTFEAGALFELHQEDDELHLEYEGHADKETSNNIDVTLRKHAGEFGFVINLFINKISDYYYLSDTGINSEELLGEDEVEEGEEEEGHEEENLPVYLFTQADAELYGAEFEIAWQFYRNLKWVVWGDHVHAELSSGEYLPRTPPQRFASELQFDNNQWSAEIGVVKYFEQDHTAPSERATEGYTLLDARVAYQFPLSQGSSGSVFLALDNITDEEARVHTSFLKDQAPLPGRNMKVGLSYRF